MKKKKVETCCNDCEANCNIKHDLDENFYTIKFCPFCGSELYDLDEDDTDEELEYDEDDFNDKDEY